jgi:hypothetical protein
MAGMKIPAIVVGAGRRAAGYFFFETGYSLPAGPIQRPVLRQRLVDAVHSAVVCPRAKQARC